MGEAAGLSLRMHRTLRITFTTVWAVYVGELVLVWGHGWLMAGPSIGAAPYLAMTLGARCFVEIDAAVLRYRRLGVVHTIPMADIQSIGLAARGNLRLIVLHGSPAVETAIPVGLVARRGASRRDRASSFVAAAQCLVTGRPDGALPACVAAPTPPPVRLEAVPGDRRQLAWQLAAVLCVAGVVALPSPTRWIALGVLVPVVVAWSRVVAGSLMGPLDVGVGGVALKLRGWPGGVIAYRPAEIDRVIATRRGRRSRPRLVVVLHDHSVFEVPPGLLRERSPEEVDLLATQMNAVLERGRLPRFLSTGAIST